MMPEGARRNFAPGEPGVHAYGWLTSLVVPRPIAWITSVSGDGVPNLAPHSFFTVASDDPPVVSFTSIGAKDTLANVLATLEFVVNLATEAHLDDINASSASFPAEVDEAAHLGLALEPSTVVSVPRLAASPASLECRLHSTVQFGQSTVVFGEVVSFSVSEAVLRDGRVDPALLRPLSRLGGRWWGLAPDVVEVRRPT